MRFYSSYACLTLFSSLVKYIVQTAPNDDPSDHVLATIGRNVGADRCYVYRFWEPGKSSMCTNTHEWCAEGIKPEIGGQQECNLADLVEFNACITSGRDFLFTDINTIDDVLTLALERHSAIVHLQAERDRVVEAEKARSYFFSSVSHDIRTPLNAGIGFSELLQDGGVPPDEAKRYFKDQGFDALLLKPVTIEKLKEVFKTLK